MSKELIRLQTKYQILDDMYIELKKKNEELRQGIINDRNDVVLVPKDKFNAFEKLKASNKKLVEAIKRGREHYKNNEPINMHLVWEQALKEAGEV